VLALPLAALALLAAEPDLDRRWEHHPSHFWLVLTVAGVNVALGLIASEAAARRDDDRTFLVSMALLASAGFLGLHALATPGILLDDITAGFSVAARVGLLLAAGFAAVSALGSDTRAVRVLARNHRRVRAVLWVLLAAWAIASLARVPLLDRPLPPDALPGPLGLLTLAGVVLYGIAAVRYAELYRRRRLGWGSRCVGAAIRPAPRCCGTRSLGGCGRGPPSICIGHWPSSWACRRRSCRGWSGCRSPRSPSTRSGGRSTSTPSSAWTRPPTAAALRLSRRHRPGSPPSCSSALCTGAAASVAVSCPALDEDQGVTLVARWGEQLDVRYIKWAHMLGFGGHFSTKSRRYSTTLAALRRARACFAAERRRRTLAGLAGHYLGEVADAESVMGPGSLAVPGLWLPHAGRGMACAVGCR
jgi:hypothetical protein